MHRRFKSLLFPFILLVISCGKEEADGTFSLEVTDSNSTLVFSFVGMVTREFALKGKTQILVTAKWDCNKDFFDSQQIGIYANSGLINNPLGGQIEIASSWILRGVIKGTYSYQTNLAENQFHNGQIEFSHYISTCDFDIDFSWSYGQFSFDNDLNSRSYSFETDLNLGRIKLIAGYSHLGLEKTETTVNEISSGLLV